MTNTVDKSPAEIKQQLFDKMAAHLLQQGSRATREIPNGDAKCMYRGEAGKMCAIGCLISDETYTYNLEGTGVFNNPDLRNAIAESQGYSTKFWSYEEDLDLNKMLSTAQRIHDNIDPANWKTDLRHTAEKFDLQWNHEAAPLTT